MASSDIESKSLMCFCWKNEHSRKRFFVNYISDPRESSSIKLTELLLHMAKQPVGSVNMLEERLALEHDNRQEFFDIEAAILASFDARYGDNMPKIYLTDKGKDLVMNIHIYKEHGEALKKLPFKRPMLLFFVVVTQSTIHKRILDVLGQPDDMKKLSAFKPEPCGKYRPTGAKAKVDDVRVYLFGASGASAGSGPSGEQQRQQQPGPRSSFKVGDHLFTFGMIDKSLKRSVYYNVIVADKPESIRLPQEMVRFAGLGLVEARREAECQSKAQEIYGIVHTHLVTCFSKLYKKEGPAAFVGKDNEKNIVINIPLHVDHAQVMMKCLMGFWRTSFYAFITDFHRGYFLKESKRHDLQQNNDMDTIRGEPKLQAIGRKATKDEIYSLMLQDKRTSLGSAASLLRLLVA